MFWSCEIAIFFFFLGISNPNFFFFFNIIITDIINNYYWKMNIVNIMIINFNLYMRKVIRLVKGGNLTWKYKITMLDILLIFIDYGGRGI